MPELPEVETVRRTLEQILIDQPEIQEMEFRRKDLRDPIPILKLRRLIGYPITSVQRRSKYLFFETPKGGVLSHLGMTGTWRAERGVFQPGPHDHAIFYLQNKLKLVYRDPRRFGVIDWAQDLISPHPRLNELGPEPLSEAFSMDFLWEQTRGRHVPIKNLLMNAKIVVGIGNIYASEILFRAGVRPTRPASRLKRVEAERIVKVSKEVLQEAIAAGGSSISDYVNAIGAKGDFQSRFRVYDREGQTCVQCQGKILRMVQAGRSSFYCRHCQI